MEKFKEAFEAYKKEENKMIRLCKDYLLDAVSNQRDGSFDLSDTNLTVVYDGDPQTGEKSNQFSKVKRVYVLNDTLFIDTNDADKIPFSVLMPEEMYEITDTVRKIIEYGTSDIED